MIESRDIRRHPDGSIDLGFYRCRATRHRQALRRLAFRAALSRLRQSVVPVTAPSRAPIACRTRHGKGGLKLLSRFLHWRMSLSENRSVVFPDVREETLS